MKNTFEKDTLSYIHFKNALFRDITHLFSLTYMKSDYYIVDTYLENEVEFPLLCDFGGQHSSPGGPTGPWI